MGEIISLIVGIGVVAAAVAFVIFCIGISSKNEKKGAESVEAEETDETLDEALDADCIASLGEDCDEAEHGGEEYAVIGARVMDMKCEGHYEGNAKHPHHHVFFNVTFLTDRGETLKFSVGQTVFDRLSLYMTGDLVTVNGNFFDFSNGEEIE